jgi:hypothetical protein
MQLVYKHKWCKIWKLDNYYELLHEPGSNLDAKAWHIEKWDDEDMFEKRWGFSTKGEALRFWQELKGE